VAPPDRRGPWSEQFKICMISGTFHISFSFPGPVVFEKKIFKDFSYINIYEIWFPLLRSKPEPQGPWFEQFKICMISGRFHISFSFSALVVLENKIFKDFSYIYIIWNKVSPNVAPPDPRGPWFKKTWICTMSETSHVNRNFLTQ
jgi:hypothetical protein